MPLTQEQFDAKFAGVEMTDIERSKKMRMYGIKPPVERVVELSASGRVVRKRGVGAAGIALVQAEQDARVDAAPNPPKYFGGQFRLMPVPECGVLAVYMKYITAEYPTLKLKAVCATCRCELAHEDPENYIGKTKVLGIASDHTRSTVNHAVYVLDENTGMYLYKSPYRILATCSK